MATPDILHVLDYFHVFQYPPTFKEIHIFMQREISAEELRTRLQGLVEKGILSQYTVPAGDRRETRYTRVGYQKYMRIYKERAAIAARKKQRAYAFTARLSQFPQIKFVGISGSVSMNNSSRQDDIDLFIITEFYRMWTVRLISLGMAQLFGVRRKYNDAHTSDTICMNLFFDESNLLIPESKQNEYVAHEVLQVKPLIDKNYLYDRLLLANPWIFGIFPNAPAYYEPLIDSAVKPGKRSLTEVIAGRVQRAIMARHRTTEIITDSQLWFFPDDFERKLRSKIELQDGST